MRQAIEITAFAATNHKPAKFRVRCAAKTKWVSRGIEAINEDDMLLRIALDFAKEMDWQGFWYGGTLKDGTHVFVCADHSTFFV